jgi:hypothetical protein
MLRLSQTVWMGVGGMAAVTALTMGSGFMTRRAGADVTAMPGQSVSLKPRAPRAAASGGQRVFVALSVIGYQPPRDGRIEVVVRAIGASGGERRDIGRFVVFPSKPISTSAPGDAQSHLFEVKGCLPADIATCIQHVEVELVAVQGPGTGASMTLGPVEIELR